MSYHTQAFGSLCQNSEGIQLVSFFLSGSVVKNLENALGKWQTGYSTENYMSTRLQENAGASFTRWWYSRMSTTHQLLCSTVSLFWVGGVSKKKKPNQQNKKTQPNNKTKRAFKQQSSFLVSILYISWENCWCRWLFWKYVQYIYTLSSLSPLMCNIVSCFSVSLAYRH